MIVDKIENISIYNNIPVVAVKFINSLNKNIQLGRYELENGVLPMSKNMKQKLIEKAKFEAHNDYVDIQILLQGNENIFITDKNILTVSEPYDKDRDICFYSDKFDSSMPIMLDSSNFVVIFPHEAHAPQVSINEIPGRSFKGCSKNTCKIISLIFQDKYSN